MITRTEKILPLINERLDIVEKCMGDLPADSREMDFAIFEKRILEWVRNLILERGTCVTTPEHGRVS